MATSLYSASLRLALPTTGDLFGTWGTEINNSITNMVDQAVAGRAVVSMPSDANYTLTALNGTSDEARCAVIRVTSAVSLTATRNIVVPLVPKLWIVDNATTGGQRIQVIGSSGTGITIPNGRAYWVRCDGTNVVMAVEDFAARIGSESTPSYTFNADSNTGMYSPGANQLAWTTDGVKRGEIDSSGRWGFGTPTTTNVWKYTAASATSTSAQEYGDYTVLSASNTSGAVSKVGIAGVSRAVTSFAGTGAVIGLQGVADLTNAVTAPLLYGVQGVISTAAAGTTTAVTGFTYSISNSGSATISANALGYMAPDISVSAPVVAGYYGAVSTGTNKWNLYVPGSARSYHAGRFLVGTGTENTSGAKLQTSDGITFPATQVASSDANTLDDYEEGTFTPTVLGSSTAGTVGYLSQQGRYVKIGGVVYIDMSVYWNSHTGTGQLQVGGLPFAASSSVVASVLSGWNLGVTMSANTTFLPGGISGGATVFGLRELALAGGGPTGIAVCSSGLVVISGVYRVD